MIIVSIKITPTNNEQGYRVWPDCDTTRQYARNLGAFGLPDDVFATVEHFRTLGHDVQVKTSQLIHTYKAYKQKHNDNE